MTRHSVRRPVLAAVAIIAGLLGFASGASAELRFDLKQADGGPFVLVSGDFAYSDSLEEFSRLVRENHPLFVTFDSPGGNVIKAIELGRLIRQSGLSTIEVKQLECASACAFAFFGGVERIAQPGAIGVHKASLAEPSAATVEGAVSSIQELTANEMAYMGEMGVDPTLLQLALAYESDDIRYLSGSEMERYKVTTKQAQGQQASSEPLPTPPPSGDRLARSPSADTNSLFSVPPAQSGRVRHPRGNAPLKALPDDQSTDLIVLPNGTPVTIVGNEGHWYRVNVSGKIGYAHDTWIFVDQFQGGSFEERHIQIKSFENYSSAEAYVRSSLIPVVAELAANGWFAITLRDSFDAPVAAQLLKTLKADGKVPDDAYITYGNTYVRKICCD